MRCLRRILRINYRQHVPNLTIMRRLGRNLQVADIVERRRKKWFGHVLRMDEGRFPKAVVTFCPPPAWRRPPGGRRQTWSRTVQADLSHLKHTYGRFWYDDWMGICSDIAQDRCQWRRVCGIQAVNADRDYVQNIGHNEAP